MIIHSIYVYAGMSQNEAIEKINIDEETAINEESNQALEEIVHETKTGLHLWH